MLPDAADVIANVHAVTDEMIWSASGDTTLTRYGHVTVRPSGGFRLGEPVDAGP